MNKAYMIMIELIDKNENFLDSDGMDYGDDFAEIEAIAKDYVKGKPDGWGLIAEYKKKASPSDIIEIWIREETNDFCSDYKLIGRIK